MRMDDRQKSQSEGGWRQQFSDLSPEAARDAERVQRQSGAATQQTAEKLKDDAVRIAEQQKRAAAEQVGGVARAVHGAADQLESQLPFAAKYIHEAADSLESASAALKQRSIDELARSIGNFARTQPTAFFSTAVLAGFALARFLKSSNGRATPGGELADGRQS
jgi:hypothetical protein